MKVVKSIIDTIIITGVVLVTLSGIVEQPSQDTQYRASDIPAMEKSQT